jgi:hypothetical protein
LASTSATLGARETSTVLSVGDASANVRSTVRTKYPPPELDKSRSPRYLYMFLCFSEQLFDTEIRLDSDTIDDDKTVFKKMNEGYKNARKTVFLRSLFYSLKGIKHVKVFPFLNITAYRVDQDVYYIKDAIRTYC